MVSGLKGKVPGESADGFPGAVGVAPVSAPARMQKMRAVAFASTVTSGQKRIFFSSSG